MIGSGFPVDRAPAEKYPTLVVFATGTGIAPIKALIESSALDVSATAVACDLLCVFGVVRVMRMISCSASYLKVPSKWFHE